MILIWNKLKTNFDLRAYKVRFSLLAISVALLVGCGGGTAGTGTEPRDASATAASLAFTGAVLQPDGTPLVGARVTLLNTDATGVTDKSGTFQFESPFAGGDAVFQLDTSSGKTTFSVPNVTSETATVAVSIVYDRDSNSVELTDLTVKAKITGVCAKYFDNGAKIVQTDPVPDRSQCAVRLRIEANDVRVDGLEFVLERGQCADDTKWRTVDSDTTGTDGAGQGRITFSWINDAPHCQYRVRGPIDVPKVTTVTVPIVTLQKKQYDHALSVTGVPPK